jgi:hypothetical protein
VTPLDSLLRKRVDVDGKSCEIKLVPPRVENIGGLIEPPATRRALAQGLLAAELSQIAVLDGAAIWNALPKERVLASPGSLDGVLRARSELYDTFAEQGRIQARCPMCGTMHELDLVFYALALKLPPWHLVDRDGLLECPRLSNPEPHLAVSPAGVPELAIESRPLAPRPPTIARAKELRVELPSARVGLADQDDVRFATLRTIERNTEAAAWRKYVPPGISLPPERLWRHWEDASFRAVLRLSVACVKLECVDGRSLVATPDTVARFFLADLQFLDLAYYATHEHAVPGDGGRARVRCACGKEFLPVA